jgi:tetratricopeptide (TPR) repeat protein
LMVAFASTAVGMVLMLRREYQPCAALVRQQIEFCTEQGFIFWSAAHEILHGASLACLDKDPQGIIQLEQGIQSWKKTGAALHIPTWSSYLAEAALCVGDLDCAEKAVSNGIDTSEGNGDVFALAELKRLSGHVLLRQDRHDEARRAFESAVEIAYRQEAGIYLLRAGLDLASLVADRGEATLARDILSPITERITEHRTGLDFIEAASLLSRLSGRC